MLKKFLIGTFVVAALAFAMGASAAYDFGTTTLKVGSKGPAVVAVQTVVGATADGSFGPMTKAKVIAWQSNHALKADGVVGAKTKAAMNEGAVVSTCPAGQFDPMTGKACGTVVTGLPTGCTVATGFSATTGAKCDGTSATIGSNFGTGTTDGSITPQASSFTSSGLQLKKGDTKDVAAIRLQASAGPVKITRVDAHFNVRPWLFFSQVALHDNTGKVLATKTLSSIADVTEISVGNDYLVRFDGLSYVVTPGTNPDLAVSASVLSTTDKIPSGGQAVETVITGIKTMSEIGYVDTVSPVLITYPMTSMSSTSAGVNNVTLTSTGSVAVLYSRLSPSSPLSGQQVISTTQVTTGVTLGVFSLKTSNNTATINTLPVTLTAGTPADFSNFRLVVNGTDVAGGVYSGGTITFSNLTIPLVLDTWTDFTVKADIAQNATSASVAVAFNINAATVTDANYGTADILTGAGTRTSGTLTLTTNAVTLSGASATLGSAIVQNNSTVGYNATYAFTLTNGSNNDLYVAATTLSTGGFLGMATPATGTGTLTNLTVSAPATAAGDVAGVSYVIPSGTSRSFTFAATLRGASNSSTTFAANLIDYGTSGDTNAHAINAAGITTGLSALTLTASF